MRSLEQYQDVAGESAIRGLYPLTKYLTVKEIVHVTTAASGDSTAEMLTWLVPVLRALGINVRWEVLVAPPPFQWTARAFHQALLGLPVRLTSDDYALQYEVNRMNAQRLSLAADVVFIHDVPPMLLPHFAPRNLEVQWVWCCHTACVQPRGDVWRTISRALPYYQCAVSPTASACRLPGVPTFTIPPAIDPLSAKNRLLTDAERLATLAGFQIDPDRPLLLQVTTFDCLEDLQGVIEAFWLLKSAHPDLQLALAGRHIDGDPCAHTVLEELRDYAEEDPAIRIVALPEDTHQVINALQRSATVVLQKSTHEGFGLAVTEALWKGKPVIGGASGGIGLQIHDYQTGFLVRSAAEIAERTCYLLEHPDRRRRMGKTGQEFVRENFLMTRYVRDYLRLLAALHHRG